MASPNTVNQHNNGGLNLNVAVNLGTVNVKVAAPKAEPSRVLVSVLDTLEQYTRFDKAELDSLARSLFPSMQEGNTILLLGPGVVTSNEKPFFGERLIEGYSQLRGIPDFSPQHLLDFVGAVFENVGYDRSDFEKYAADQLKGAHAGAGEVPELYQRLTGVRWNMAITTTPDLFLEQAFDEREAGAAGELKLIPVYNKGDFERSYPAQNEVIYVKLNGCVSDKKAHRLILTEEELNGSRKFYKKVFDSLSAASPRIKILAIGFTQTDPLSKRFFDFIEAVYQRYGKWLYVIDPYIDPLRLKGLATKRVCIIRCQPGQFLDYYQDWVREAASSEFAAPARIRRKTEQHIPISPLLGKRAGLGTVIIQINEVDKVPVVEAEDFYRGQEPSYHVIRRSYDVIKTEKLSQVKAQIQGQIELIGSKEIPIFFLKGQYGSGKSTFTYRLIHTFLHDPEQEYYAFHVANIGKLDFAAFAEVILQAGFKNVILFVESAEQDSVFKDIVRLQSGLNTQELSECRIFILVSIRENILEKYLATGRFSNLVHHQINVDFPFTKAQALELVSKLAEQHLIEAKDALARDVLAHQICTTYKGDSLISLLHLVSDGSHEEFIMKAYRELSRDLQVAFLYTSLLYRFKIQMPSYLLRTLVSQSWDEFIHKVIAVDGKGILMQVVDKTARGNESDLYFVTRHATISESLVKQVLRSPDKRFGKYEEIVSKLIESPQGATLSINLLEALKRAEDLDTSKINKLYDLCAQKLSENEHFLVHYARNLQSRDEIAAIEKGIDLIRQAGAARGIFYRNHRLLHRRGMLHFALAKLLYNLGDVDQALEQIDSAREFFDLKKRFDTKTAFSYADFIRMEVWYLDHVELPANEYTSHQVLIESLIEEGLQTVTENVQWVHAERVYYETRMKVSDSDAYLHSLEERFAAADDATRPYVLILMYYFYERRKDTRQVEDLVDQLERYEEVEMVARLLFIYYGKHLYNAQNRNKLYGILRRNQSIEEREKFYYYYYQYISETYNGHLVSAFEHLLSIRTTFGESNSEMFQYWCSAEGEKQVFAGTIREGKQGRKEFKSSSFRTSVALDRKIDLSKIDLKDGRKFNAYIKFYPFGYRAELIIKLNDQKDD
jgi:uncharacterized protein (DUF1697 family)